MRGAAVAAGILMIACLHFATPVALQHWHNVFQHLYYLPIFCAGLTFGWRGGLAAACAAGLLQVPHILASWTVQHSYAVDQILEAPLFCAAGILTGILVERERKQRQDLIRTTNQLSEVYNQLQHNFERMKRAERLYAIGQLSAGLAHEIRNPLASIAGAAGILRRNPAAESRRGECLDIIQRECERLNRLLTHFLDFARPRAPKFQIVELGPILDAVVDLAGHAVGGNAVTLRQETAPNLKPLECDPEQLKQVLLNLMINAIQASGGNGEVVLAARPQGGSILIQVRDNGSGIRTGDLDKIFDPFFTTKENGTGLGLSVAHQIVEQHGGILNAGPNPGGGTIFSLLLQPRRTSPL